MFLLNRKREKKAWTSSLERMSEIVEKLYNYSLFCGSVKAEDCNAIGFAIKKSQGGGSWKGPVQVAGSYSQFPKTVSRWLLHISTDGDSTTFLNQLGHPHGKMRHSAWYFSTLAIGSCSLLFQSGKFVGVCGIGTECVECMGNMGCSWAPWLGLGSAWLGLGELGLA